MQHDLDLEVDGDLAGQGQAGLERGVGGYAEVVSDRQLLLVRCIRQSESFAAAWLVEGVGRVEHLGGASEA